MVEEIWCEEDDELVGLEFELSFFRRYCPSLITPPVGLKIGEFGKLVGKKKRWDTQEALLSTGSKLSLC